ncbi:MAG: MFS transporter [Opitutaceae bacterium]|jgi:MFS family permease
MTPILPANTLPAHGQSTATTYHCGTLVYSSRDLGVLFLFLFGGDFAFVFFESIFGRYLPLVLGELNASNMLIGLMSGSFAGIVNILFLPNISRWSDGFRSRLGRRIPFLLVASPLTVLACLLSGFAPEIASFLHRNVTATWTPSVSERTLTLCVLCVSAALYHFFNMILVNSYNWLFKDVVPDIFMARFLTWFRIVGAFGMLVFLWFVFPHIIEYRKTVFTCVGVFYLVVFTIMCWCVKEGEYPPVPKKEKTTMLRSFVGYFRECVSVPIYRNYFIVFVCVILGMSCAGAFITLFMRETLLLNMKDIGANMTWATLAVTVMYYPVGWLCDKTSPFLVTLVSLPLYAIVSIAAMLLVENKAGMVAYWIVIAIPTVGWGLGSAATTMKLFPSAKFGQFSSGLNVFGCGALTLGNVLIGQIMDMLNSNYRFAFLWSAIFFAVAILPMVLVLREWKRLGGADHYNPPLPT